MHFDEILERHWPRKEYPLLKTDNENYMNVLKVYD